MPEPISGLLLLDKPEGPTSSMRPKWRVRLKEKRIGHCGTLDPMAQGVLVLFWQAHPAADEFLTMENILVSKRAGSHHRFRRPDGKRSSRRLWNVTLEALVSTAKSFLRRTLQTPPMVSAIKHKGKPLTSMPEKAWTSAHPRPIRITEFDILKFDGRFYEARVSAPAGPTSARWWKTWAGNWEPAGWSMHSS